MQIKNYGFTLIELLVVISIIGLLASVVLVSLNSARQKSRDAKRLADINQIAKGLEIFYNQASAYPTGSGYTSAGGAVFGSATLSAVTTQGTTNLTPAYMTFAPSAPVPNDGSCNVSNNRYMYEASSAGNTYTLSFCLGATTGNFTPGVKYLTPAGIR